MHERLFDDVIVLVPIKGKSNDQQATTTTANNNAPSTTTIGFKGRAEEEGFEEGFLTMKSIRMVKGWKTMF